MRTMEKWARWAVLATLALSGVGCGERGPEVGEVRGLVTLDGSPLANAQLVFTPATGRPSTGVTGEDGRYELVYLRDQKGAVLGKHTVRITTLQRSTSDRGEDPPFREKIPPQYNEVTTLSTEVHSGENTCDFALTTK